MPQSGSVDKCPEKHVLHIERRVNVSGLLQRPQNGSVEMYPWQWFALPIGSPEAKRMCCMKAPVSHINGHCCMFLCSQHLFFCWRLLGYIPGGAPFSQLNKGVKDAMLRPNDVIHQKRNPKTCNKATKVQ